MTEMATMQRQLLESLYKKTLDKSIEWTYDEAEDSCQASLGGGYVDIIQDVDDENGEYYTVVRVLNGRKQVIDRITGGTLSRLTPEFSDHKTYWALITDLKIAAERAAKGADVVIQTILDALGADTMRFKPKFDVDDDVPF